MSLEQIDKKIREAGFFLAAMRERARMAFGEHERFDFSLSAFLSATRTIDYRLRHEEGAVYAGFLPSWRAALPSADRDLIKFMIDDRNLEVHQSGSGRLSREEALRISGEFEDRSGKIFVSGPPGDNWAEIIKPIFVFNIAGREMPVVDTCQAYLTLIR